jgi:hypothetical protein
VHIASHELALEVLTTVLEIFLCFVLLRRRTWREFPMFCAFAFELAARSVLLLVLLPHTKAELMTYFLVYWITQAIQSALMLGVVVEIIEDVCLPGKMLSARVMRVFGWFALSITVGAYTLVHLQNPTKFPILNAFISLDRICAYVALGVLGVLVVFSQFFSVHWRTLARASASGLSAVTLVTTVLPGPSQFFPGTWRTVALIVSPAVTALVLVMWIVAFGWKATRCCSSAPCVSLTELFDQASQLDRDAAA